MKQFKRRITTIVGAILIALGLIGINADPASAQGKARKDARISSPRDHASGQGVKANQTSKDRNASGKRNGKVQGGWDIRKPKE